MLVAGSALFRDPEGLAHAVSDLRARGVAAPEGLSLRPAASRPRRALSQVGEVALEAPGRLAKRNTHRSTGRDQRASHRNRVGSRLQPIAADRFVCVGLVAHAVGLVVDNDELSRGPS